jgi:hypothetical protein
MDVEKYRRTNVLFQVAHLYGRDVSILKHVSKSAINDIQFEQIKKYFYSDRSNMPLQTLRRECDEQYLQSNKNELSQSLASITNNKEFPKDLTDPDQTFIGRGFFILWLRGGEQNKPSAIFDVSMEINASKEWVVENERKFFEVIHEVLVQ